MFYLIVLLHEPLELYCFDLILSHVELGVENLIIEHGKLMLVLAFLSHMHARTLFGDLKDGRHRFFLFDVRIFYCCLFGDNLIKLEGRVRKLKIRFLEGRVVSVVRHLRLGLVTYFFLEFYTTLLKLNFRNVMKLSYLADLIRGGAFPALRA